MNVNSLLSAIVDRLQQVRGVSAIVLGGSRARGTENPKSDIDIGIYYDSAEGLDLDGLRQAAAQLDDEHREDLVTDIGEWGPWINGGGWLTVSRMPVDFLLRDLRRVAQVLDDCVSGRITVDYQPGHPHGFVNSIYLAEIALCKVLWDPSGAVDELKRRTFPLPPEYQKAVIGRFLWEASFSLDNGAKGVAKADLPYVAGSCFRTGACLNQVLFALNGAYLMNEKGAAAIADGFPRVPARYSTRLNELFARISENEEALSQTISGMRELVRETEALLRDGGLF
ncbi:nucleotidyltransferase domain-containing protein [Gorillibacterium sp. sgz500922]|uniref:nucleotidyltransferase domain-containing protein n=1 Tax=Gorillibacterium sp. sgz500922 TaxID=3446694 RepID=UPI003F66EC81